MTSSGDTESLSTFETLNGNEDLLNTTVSEDRSRL